MFAFYGFAFEIALKFATCLSRWLWILHKLYYEIYCILVQPSHWIRRLKWSFPERKLVDQQTGHIREYVATMRKFNSSFGHHTNPMDFCEISQLAFVAIAAKFAEVCKLEPGNEFAGHWTRVVSLIITCIVCVPSAFSSVHVDVWEGEADSNYTRSIVYLFQQNATSAHRIDRVSFVYVDDVFVCDAFDRGCCRVKPDVSSNHRHTHSPKHVPRQTTLALSAFSVHLPRVVSDSMRSIRQISRPNPHESFSNTKT